jgi:hypothetical protein
MECVAVSITDAASAIAPQMCSRVGWRGDTAAYLLIGSPAHPFGLPVVIIELGFELSLLPPQAAHCILALARITQPHAQPAGDPSVYFGLNPSDSVFTEANSTRELTARHEQVD